MTTYEHYQVQEEGIINVWNDIGFDCERQTGSDWYNVMLSASFGGKQVHGADTFSALESISKVSAKVAKGRTVGKLKVKKEKRNIPKVKEATEWENYAGKRFDTVRSSTKTHMVLEEDHWEPSIRTRAKNTAVLASMFEECTGSREETKLILSAITCEDIGDDVFDLADLAHSSLKRESMVSGNTNHSVYGTGNLQSAIVWEDFNLTKDILPLNAAMDWAKITCVARFIGEINVKYDPKFLLVASNMEIPYAIVSNSYAIVSTADYNYSSLDFDLIKLPDTSFIPSLKGAFSDHHDDVIAIAMRMVRDANSNEISTMAAEMLDLAAKVRRRKDASSSKITIMEGTDTLAPVTSHAYTMPEIARMVASSVTTNDVYINTCANIVTLTPSAFEAAKRLAAGKKKGIALPGEEGTVRSICLEPTTWMSALANLSKALNDADTAQRRLGSYKRSLTGSSAALSQKIIVSGVGASNMRATVYAVATRAAIGKGPKPPDIEALVNPVKATKRSEMTKYLQFVDNHFANYAKAWADRYSSWSTAYASLEETKADAVLYGLAAKAFETLESHDLLSRSSGYYDGREPNSTYIGLSASNYARKRRLNNPDLTSKRFTTMSRIAEALDEQYHPDITFVEAESFVRSRLDQFANDLEALLEPRIEKGPDLEELERRRKKIEKDKQEELEIEAIFEAGWKPQVAQKQEVNYEELLGADMLAMLEGNNNMFGGGLFAPPTEQDVLGTYDNVEEAERHAGHHGYSSFSDAYKDLGERARYDIESEYTRFALMQEIVDEESSEDEDGPSLA